MVSSVFEEPECVLPLQHPLDFANKQFLTQV